MGEAVDRAYAMISIMTDEYSKSQYAMAGQFFLTDNGYSSSSRFVEPMYAFEKKIKIIPCTLTPEFNATGGLGLLKAGRMTIEFHGDRDFDQMFEQLVNEIDEVENESQQAPLRLLPVNFTPNTEPPSDQTSLHDRIMGIFQRAAPVIDSTTTRWNDLTEEQRQELLRQLTDDLSPAERASNTTDSTHVLKDFLKHNQQIYNNLQQQIAGVDERLSAVMRLMNTTNQHQPPSSIQILQNPNESQQNQLNQQISGQLSQTFELLKLAMTSQQEQHQRETELSHRVIDGDMIMKIVHMIIVLLALAVLFKKD